MQQNSISQFWQQGDWVSHLVLFFLLAMSVYSWWVIASQGLRLRRIAKSATSVEQFWHSADFETATAQFDTTTYNPFAALVQTAQEANNHHRKTQVQLHDSLDVSDWVTRCLHNALDDASSKLGAGLPILASIGSTAPFVGLFGTVWGIYHALLSMGSAQTLALNDVAGPVGEALVMTALGLAVAVPAVLGYNTLLRKQKAIGHQLKRFAHDLHAYFLTGQRLAASNLRAAS
jgi:biopolymer transport protein ExbB